MQYLIPAIILLTVAVGAARRVNVYNCFLQGTKNGLSLCVTLFPYIATMFVLINFMEVSGVGDVLSKWIAPLLSWTGIPVELARLVVIRPFTASGSLALLNDIYATYGTDSYIARSASVIMGSSETVFYLSAVYFHGTKVKNSAKAVAIAMLTTMLGCVLSCLLCRFM